MGRRRKYCSAQPYLDYIGVSEKERKGMGKTQSKAKKEGLPQLGREKLLANLSCWFGAHPFSDRNEKAYKQIKHAITVFKNVIEPKSRAIEQKPKVEKARINTWAERLIEVGSISGDAQQYVINRRKKQLKQMFAEVGMEVVESGK